MAQKGKHVDETAEKASTAEVSEKQASTDKVTENQEQIADKVTEHHAENYESVNETADPEAYAKWYAQYVQYWQQYQQQNNDPLYDSEYHQFIQMHGSSNVASAGSLYESRRSSNMLNHYFDAQQQYASVVQPAPVTGRAQKKKPTKEELEYWRKRKEETKKIRNRWLYQ